MRLWLATLFTVKEGDAMFEDGMVNPLLCLSCPETIEMEPLTLRAMQAGDGHRLYEAFLETKDILERWFEWAVTVKGPEDLERTAKNFYRRFQAREEFHFVAFSKEKLIGCTSLHHIDVEEKSAELGFWVRKSEQGRGYAKEMVRALCFYGRRHLHLSKVKIVMDEENKKSAAVAEQSGFFLEKKAPGLCSVPGGGKDRMCLCYARFLETSWNGPGLS